MPLEQPQFELLALLFLPLAAALVVGLLGHERKDAIRWLSLGAASASLILSFVLAWRLAAEQRALGETPAALARQLHPTFRPFFVPGCPGTAKDNFGREHQAPHGTSWDLLWVSSVWERGAPPVVQFYIGLDGLNVWLVVLTAVLSVPAVLVSWNQVTERVNEFYAWLLALQTAMMGIFLSFDIVLFYVFFELSLVPLFFLIGIWGGPERRHAAGKFFIYTLAGSLITLLGVIGIVFACQSKSHELTFSIPELVRIVHQRVQLTGAERVYWTAWPNGGDILRVMFGLLSPEAAPNRWGGVMYWVFLALTAGFAVKVPLVPFHTWLPLAHVEAPTAGSVDLAGVLLKVGAYGFLRLCVPLAPDVSLTLGLPLVSGLAALGIVYGAFCAYAQDDIKRMVAYSSVSHLGLCMLGMFALNVAGLSGSLLQMINHGLSTGGLFLLVGMLYERYHTRKISDFGGLAARMPLFSACMVFIVLTSVGLPGLNGFIGEALALMGIFDQQYERGQFPIYALLGALGMVLGAWYLFTMLRQVFCGPVKEPPVLGEHQVLGDLNFREIALIAPVMALCLLIGLMPQPILETIRPDVQTVARIAELARRRGDDVTVGAEPEDQSGADEAPRLGVAKNEDVP